MPSQATATAGGDRILRQVCCHTGRDGKTARDGIQGRGRDGIGGY